MVPEAPTSSAAGQPPAPIDQRLVELTLLAVLGRFAELTHWRQALTSPPGQREREALLQVHLFAGFPRVVEAFGVLDGAGGLGSAGPDELLREAPNRPRGRLFFERIYRQRSDQVAEALERYHPELAEWVLGHAYGRVLSRPGLSLLERELLAVVALIATEQERQLASHVRGAVALGATPDELTELLNSLRGHLPVEAVERARRVIEHFARRA